MIFVTSVPFKHEKVQICKIMFGRFAVKIQQCIKSQAVFGNFFRLLKFLQFSTNCLMRGIKGWMAVFLGHRNISHRHRPGVMKQQVMAT